MEKEGLAREFAPRFRQIAEEIGKAIVGNEAVVTDTLLALFAGGHALFEGVPGLGKTMLVKAISQSLDFGFSRIQFTPDLMPGDITGTNIVTESAPGRKEFEFRKGPVFSNIVLADEINRATPKTQSALLEAMQEGTVSFGGTTHALPKPFFVVATQNPIEMEGTYPLPEAQLDRFLFKISLAMPNEKNLASIVGRTTVNELPTLAKVMTTEEIRSYQEVVRDVIASPQAIGYASNIVLATHPETPAAPNEVKQYVKYGASPRGAQALIIGAKARALSSGRFNVSLEDIAATAAAALRHRIILNFEGEAATLTTDSLIATVLDSTAA